MAHYKRKKNRRKVRCALCTPHRNGNAKWDQPVGVRRQTQEALHALGN